MNKKIASVKLSFERTKSNLVSVKLRITHERTQRRFAFPIKNGVLISEKDFERLVKYHETGNERVAEEIRLLYNKLRPYIDKATHLASSISPFSFEAFRESFLDETPEENKNVDNTNVLAALNEKAALMRRESRLGNALNYELVGKSLLRFINSMSDEDKVEFLNYSPVPKRNVPAEQPPILRFEHITKDFLKVYEQWMLVHGKAQKKKVQPGEIPNMDTPASLTTVGIYCRHLRSVYNDAIEAGHVDRACYPFGKNRYIIPAGANIKKALKKEDVMKIINYPCKPGFEQRARDLWVFSYLSNGMNFADILKLKVADLDLETNQISFVRQKTARATKGGSKRIRINLIPFSEEVIDRWKTQSSRPSSFLFDILKEGMDVEQQKKTIQQVIKITNQYMRGIAKQLEITGDVNTYAARHSFSTILLQSEAPIAFISQALGHANIKTTEAYLGSFDDEKTKKYLKALI
ncbi:tyrosine-type recombinase/integrase [Dyadobacter crusticola]|uniref:tyrosine-type recombinase/integrase n=1 Tax=Dyadobacter crusticola TaxID=292407 RepID=UPI0004E191B8|nr:tyrosine-type recombinase/integrase [Dyadobacter crusticola]